MKVSTNFNLNQAKRNKNDEYYTQYKTIADELIHYYEYDKNVFRNKTILCPCDDPESSEFVNYFRDNFDTFGIKKLIFTSYTSSLNNKNIKNDVISLLSNINSSNKQDTRGKLLILDRNNINTNVNFSYLKGNGDFRSKEVKNYLDEADMVVTNPPFSLFRDFIDWIISSNKQFIIIGNINIVTYKNVFSLIKDNEIWFGCTNTPISYKTPPNNELVELRNTRWYTNVLHKKRFKKYDYINIEEIKEITKNNKKFQEYGFVEYDNYKAIEIPDCRYIPNDYDGVMGVAVTFFDRYNPEQFLILGASGVFDDDLVKPNIRTRTPSINNKDIYKRIFIKHKKD